MRVVCIVRVVKESNHKLKAKRVRVGVEREERAQPVGSGKDKEGRSSLGRSVARVALDPPGAVDIAGALQEAAAGRSRHTAVTARPYARSTPDVTRPDGDG